MTDATKFQFSNPSVPKAYEEFFVPRLFEPWGKLLLDEAKLMEGQAIIDVATGPGTVARLAAPRLGSKGRIVATDISRPMLDIAKAKPDSGIPGRSNSDSQPAHGARKGSGAGRSVI